MLHLASSLRSRRTRDAGWKTITGMPLVLGEKCTRDPIQIREMANDHDVVFEPGGFSPKGVDIVVLARCR